MAKWNFTATASALVATLDDDPENVKEYTGCEAVMGNERINILISGHFKTAFIFSQIGTIDGETPTDIYDAFDLISAIIPESGGGGSFVPSEHDLDEFQNENADPFARISDVGGATSTQSYSPDSFIVVGVLTSFTVPANTEVISVVSNDAPLDNALWSQTGTSVSIPTAVNGDKLQFSGITFSATPPSDAVFAASVNGQTGTVVLDADDVSDASTTNKFTTAAEKTIWNAKQDALGYTAENTVNKSTALDTDKASNTKYSTPKSIYDWGVGLFAPIITAANFGSFINGLTGKTTPVDADYVGLMDSAASNVQKKLSWANIKATLLTYFDTKYAPLSAVAAIKYITIDQATTNDASVPVAVTDLIFAAAANTKYAVSGVVKVGCSAAGGVRFGFTVPSGATFFISSPARGGTSTGVIWNASQTTNTLAVATNTLANGNGMIFFGGTVTVGATAGDIQMIFSSGTAGQTSTLYSEGTFLKFEK